MRFPGRIEPETVAEDLVQPHDIAATALALAGVDPAERASAMPHSLDLLAGERRDLAVSLYRNSGYGPAGRYFDPPIHATMAHDGRYKLTVYHHVDIPDRDPEGELYDLEEDPRELRNLWSVPEHGSTRTRLMSRLMDWTVAMDTIYNGTRGGEAVTFRAT
jgi:arylsulfatase A-like enzyme